MPDSNIGRLPFITITTLFTRYKCADSISAEIRHALQSVSCEMLTLLHLSWLHLFALYLGCCCI
eukprot:m.254280 g.254280  ORF g.254280 m.254280 type:complete len:64 (+) comp19603_c0_seq8:1192-1383(+)